MKNCVICDKEFETNRPYAKFCGDVCRKENHRIKAGKYYTPRTPKSYTKQCKACDKIFTTGNVRNSHQIKYCSNECNAFAKKERDSSKEAKEQSKQWRIKNRERLLKQKKEYHARTFVPKPPEKRTCPSCNTDFLTSKNKQGYGSLKVYCSKACNPNQLKRAERRQNTIDLVIKCQWCRIDIDYKGPINIKRRVKFCSSKCMTANRMSNPKNRISARFRTLISTYNVRKGARKTSKSFEVLGYTKEDLCNHIESLFVDGMSWDNMHLWHIDHIRPFASFNFDSTDHPDFKKCWALNNLQPLWAKDNLSKNGKWDGVVNA